MSPHFRVLFFLLFLAAAGGARINVPGSWIQIKNLHNPYVQGLANFAVDEHNRESQDSLKLTDIKDGEIQIITSDEANYLFAITAMNGTVAKDYQAILWDKVSTQERKLISFIPAYD